MAAVRDMWTAMLKEVSASDPREMYAAGQARNDELNSHIREMTAIFMIRGEDEPKQYETQKFRYCGFVALRDYPVLSGHARNNILEIVGMYVMPTHRGQDWGKRLLARADQYAEENGYDHLILYVNVFNTRAIDIYGKDGFEFLQNIMTRPVRGGQ
jgi:ribosomal protein S18 acetylase RimI-like enzyme